MLTAECFIFHYLEQFHRHCGPSKRKVLPGYSPADDSAGSPNARQDDEIETTPTLKRR